MTQQGERTSEAVITVITPVLELKHDTGRAECGLVGQLTKLLHKKNVVAVVIANVWKR